jgi:hypothetical protein
MTIKQHWDDCIPGNPDSGRPWERPFLKGRITVEVKGMTFCPFRIATDGNVFRLDAQLRDGRTLRLLLPPTYPCERLPHTHETPLPADNTAESLGFEKRNYHRAVTDADRLTLDLTANKT